MTAVAVPQRGMRRRANAVNVWPSSFLYRWLLRLGVAVPTFALLYWVTQILPLANTANDRLAARGDLIVWGASDLYWVAKVFPPLSAALSSIIRGNGLAMLAIAALVIGLLSQRAMGVLRRRQFGWPATFAVLATIWLSPALYFLASRDLQSILGLALLLLALDSLETFVVNRSTEHGFWAGIALGVAVMVDPSMWVFVVIIAAIGPFIAERSGHLGPGSHGATAIVLSFPALAALGFWIFVSWWFTADALGVLRGFADPWFPGGVGGSARAAGSSLVFSLASSPLFLVAYTMRLRLGELRRLVAPTVAVVGMVLALWLGVRSAGGHSYLLMILLYIVVLSPMRPSRRRQGLIIGSALAQLVLAWFLPLVRGSSSPIGSWVRDLWQAIFG
ncbi:hypothetical protein GCM10010401_07820 [Rarobacter faecitabidus]|uniref:Alpha-1,2-mannosyltransferase n=1 Tax=Rarobacter faecitabidus TaxID=13243 RepID=A0A542ZAM5_RARFA|nr:hypothetical protein [Rarobacter faecitabidus]TQL57389.1 hypothetical protein FB461_2123 [Rarobacter faecitabidus]